MTSSAHSQLTTSQPSTQNISPDVLPSVGDWLTQLGQMWAAHKAYGWGFVFSLTEGMDSYADDEHARADLLMMVADQLDINPKTLQNYVSIGRSPAARIACDLDLSISHASTCVGLSETSSHRLLELAAEQRWTVPKLRLERDKNPDGYEEDPVPSTGPEKRCPHCGGLL